MDNFINTNIVSSIYFLEQNHDELRVMIANDKRIKSPSQNKDVPLQLGTHLFPCLFYL